MFIMMIRIAVTFGLSMGFALALPLSEGQRQIPVPLKIPAEWQEQEYPPFIWVLFNNNVKYELRETFQHWRSGVEGSEHTLTVSTISIPSDLTDQFVLDRLRERIYLFAGGSRDFQLREEPVPFQLPENTKGLVWTYLSPGLPLISTPAWTRSLILIDIGQRKITIVSLQCTSRDDMESLWRVILQIP